MSTFKTHSIESAPEASKPLLEGAQKAYQFVPNLLATMAEAPSLLEGSRPSDYRSRRVFGNTESVPYPSC